MKGFRYQIIFLTRTQYEEHHRAQGPEKDTNLWTNQSAATGSRDQAWANEECDYPGELCEPGQCEDGSDQCAGVQGQDQVTDLNKNTKLKFTLLSSTKKGCVCECVRSFLI